MLGCVAFGVSQLGSCVPVRTSGSLGLCALFEVAIEEFKLPSPTVDLW